ncbi:unnamed protein product [Moneuplotes crassus]|uniref:Uncharacterized protein n=1 Tax=Euplotes crassus TaxID=5936 RepID=A0AAD1XQ68_EUPCR|nr:unnamed protein product [Moneuplotes crassus]
MEEEKEITPSPPSLHPDNQSPPITQGTVQTTSDPNGPEPSAPEIPAEPDQNSKKPSDSPEATPQNLPEVAPSSVEADSKAAEAHLCQEAASEEDREEGLEEEKSSHKKKKRKTYYYTVLKGNYPQNVIDAIKLRKNWKQCKEDKDMFEASHFIWKPTNFSSKSYGKIDLLMRKGKKLVFNHLEKIKGISTKTGLVGSLKRYYERCPEAAKMKYNVFDSTPTTFIISPNLDGDDFKMFNHLLKSSKPKTSNSPTYRDDAILPKHCESGTWLVKPSCMNRGRGIEIFHSKEEILNFISSKPVFSRWVVQKYIERPLLYKGRKFDLRVWACVNHLDEVFFYEKGYVRLSSEEYDLDNQNNYVHLTNNCLQQHGEKYGVHEEGNTIGYEALQEYLDETFPDLGISVEKHFIPRIKDLILDTFFSIQSDLRICKRNRSFEFFGYDFLIDEDFRVWLIECNSNPYIGKVNPYIKVLVENMLDDLLKTCLDPYFKPKHVDDPDRKNLFELIYSPGGTMNSKEMINHRRDYSWDDLYLSSEIKDVFLEHRFPPNNDLELKPKGLKGKSPQKQRKGQFSLARDDSCLQKSDKKESLQLYNAYSFTQSNIKPPRIKKRSYSKETRVKMDASRTETVFPEIKKIIEERPPTKISSKNFSNHNQRSRTLLKKKQKKLEDTEKLEEQLTYMAKFNQDVRERNRLRSIKEQGLSHSKNDSHVKTLDSLSNNKPKYCTDAEMMSITPSKKITTDEYYHKEYVLVKDKKAKFEYSVLHKPKAERKQRMNISTDRRQKPSLKRNKVESCNLSISSRLSENHPNDCKVKINLNKIGKTKLPELGNKKLSSEMTQDAKNVTHRAENQQNSSIQTLESNFTKILNKKSKGAKQTSDSSKKRKLRDVKKLKQFSPYFGNMLKSQTRFASITKRSELIEEKRSQNSKLYKIYGLGNTKRYKKKLQ